MLLDDLAAAQTLQVMRRHLSSSGRAVFESRNPCIDWASRWDYEITLEHAGQNIRESRQFIEMSDDRITFELEYQFPDQTLTSRSELRFLPRQQIETSAIAAGFEIESVFGDWQGQEFVESSSEEMIFTLRPA